MLKCFIKYKHNTTSVESFIGRMIESKDRHIVGKYLYNLRCDPSPHSED